MKNTCALCGRDVFYGRFGLCTNCLKEWTATGTHPLPHWLMVFKREHHAFEMKRLNQEIPFSHAPAGVLDGSYTEVRYGIIEGKYHKTKRRGRGKSKNSKNNIV